MAEQKKRTGSWEQIKVLTDPQSNVSVLISERIRGKPAYSIQVVHIDSMGPNKHIELPVPGEHSLADIVFSLCKAADAFIEKRS